MYRDQFDLDAVLSSANQLKYTNMIKTLKSEFEKPDDEFVKYFASRAQDGAHTQKVREQFTPLVTKAVQRFLTTIVDERIASALSGHKPEAILASEPEDDSPQMYLMSVSPALIGLAVSPLLFTMVLATVYLVSLADPLIDWRGAIIVEDWLVFLVFCWLLIRQDIVDYVVVWTIAGAMIAASHAYFPNFAMLL